MFRKISPSLIGALSVTFILLFVSLPASAQPCLDVSHDSLTFSGDHCDSIYTPQELDSLSIAVMNCGTDTLDWYVIADRSWIGHTPSYGSGFDSIFVFIRWDQVPIDPDTLIPGDSILLQSYLRIFASNAQPDTMKNVLVKLWLKCNESTNPLDLVVTPSSFTFDLAPDRADSGVFVVTEAENRTVGFSATNMTSWLTLPVFFTQPTTPSSIPFWVSSAGLTPGTYFDTITVIGFANDSLGTPFETVLIPVVLKVTDPPPYSIEASPDLFTFYLDPGDSVMGESLYVYESSGNTINFWTYNQDSWLFVDTFAASPLYTPETITFDIHTAGLTPGYHSDSIFIWGDSAGSQPFLVPIQVHITDTTPLALSASPASFAVNLDAGSSYFDSLYITEISGRSIPFSLIYDSTSWLSVQPSTEPHWTPQAFTIGIHADTLQVGTYLDTIFLVSDSPGVGLFNPVAVPVTMTVTVPSSTIQAWPAGFDLYLLPDDTLANQLITVSENYGRNLEFAVETRPGSNWVDLQTTSGTMPDSIFFDAITTGLAPNDIVTDSIVIYNPLDDSSQYFEKIIPVNIHVVSDSSFEVVAQPSELSLQFTQGSGAGAVTFIYETQWRPFSFVAVNNSHWLDFTGWCSSGTAFNGPCSLWVYNADSNLAPGMYYDTIAIFPDTNGVSFDPLFVPVTAEVLPSGAYVETDPVRFDIILAPDDSVVGLSFEVYDVLGYSRTYDIQRLGTGGSWLELRYPPLGAPTLPRMPDTVEFAVFSSGFVPGAYISDTFMVYNPLESTGPNAFWVKVPITLSVVADSQMVCGDVNGDGVGPDISDLSYLVGYMFQNGPPPPYEFTMKFTTQVDIVTLTRLVDYMFKSGGELTCSPVQ